MSQGADKYNLAYLKMDNPLLPKAGIPIAQDDFVDSTANIVNATNINDVQLDSGTKVGTQSVYYAQDSGLAGIDNSPGSKKKFDLAQFNKDFDINKDRALKSQIITDQKKLNALADSANPPKVSLYNLSLFQIIVNTKDAWFNLLDDLLDYQFNLDTFTKDNRLFYIGLTIIFFALVLYLYAMIITDQNTIKNDNVTDKDKSEIKTIYNIYQYPVDQNKTQTQTQSKAPGIGMK